MEETKVTLTAPVTMRLLTYNILKGGHEREAEIVKVIEYVAPDVVVVQEVLDADNFQQIATALGMSPYLAQSQGRLPLRVGLLSKLPVLDFRTLHLWPLWPSCLQATVRLKNANSLTIFGLHLAAYYPGFLERWRMHQLRALLRYIRRTAPGMHLLAGDFNAIAPGDQALLMEAPPWVKAQAWFQLGYIPRWALRSLLDAGYVDCFRKLHPKKDGFTLPSPHPQVRLDYVFATPPLARTLRECRVITEPEKVASASDHLPLLAEFEWEI
jgi:exodeoxyribonuclease-3